MTAPQPGDGRPTIVVMGVSGCGKSAVGAALGRAMRLPFVEGDRLHSPESVAKMSRGVPLTDEDRWPWLDRVGAVLGDRATYPEGVIVACSSLRRSYRDRIRAAGGPATRFLFLDGPKALLAARMNARKGHFMPPSLLDSQFATLERPGADEPSVFAVDVGLSVRKIVEAALAHWGAG